MTGRASEASSLCLSAGKLGKLKRFWRFVRFRPPCRRQRLAACEKRCLELSDAENVAKSGEMRVPDTFFHRLPGQVRRLTPEPPVWYHTVVAAAIFAPVGFACRVCAKVCNTHRQQTHQLQKLTGVLPESLVLGCFVSADETSQPDFQDSLSSSTVACLGCAVWCVA